MFEFVIWILLKATKLISFYDFLFLFLFLFICICYLLCYVCLKLCTCFHNIKKKKQNQINQTPKLTSPTSRCVCALSWLVMKTVVSQFHHLHRVAHSWPQQQHRPQQQQYQTMNTSAHHLTQIQQPHRSHRQNKNNSNHHIHTINHQQPVRHSNHIQSTISTKCL